MSLRPYYAKGDWNCICDRCGRELKASQLRKEWDNLMVCVECWEPRQPQDFVRGVPDRIGVPWARPEAQDQFIGFCTPAGMSAWADTATPDCVRPDFISPAYDPTVDYTFEGA